MSAMPKKVPHFNREKSNVSIASYIQKLHNRFPTMNIRIFHFNPIQVNTYVLSDDDGEAVIVDPGNCEPRENEMLRAYITDHNLLVKYILSTHPHIDHILGNDWCVKEYRVPLCMHAAGLSIYEQAFAYAAAFGIDAGSFPPPTLYLKDGDVMHYGCQRLQVLYTPGHCDGSITFYDPENRFVLCGDLIFENSIGRFDLPTGNENILLNTIKEKIMSLGDDVKIYPGHGDATTVGNERIHNPYLK